MSTFFADQIGSTGRYAVARVKFGVKKWFSQDDGGLKTWGDPHVPSSDNTVVFDFDQTTATLFGAALTIADS